ncbi:GUN4 domain-containing protein [Nostoc carneum NIES-2107]|nr:GUN4 domain-containing protein [Nostoc carneum NIES-2107]
MAKFALLIGVSEYEPGLQPLPSAVKDVEAMQRILLHPEIGGFDDAIVLKNSQRQEIEVAIFNLFANRKKEDLLLLYFSGHGIVTENNEFFLSTRSTNTYQGKLIPPTAVAATYIHQQMQQSRSRHQVIILDCCYSGAFTKGLHAKDTGTVNIINQLGGEGRAILTASNSTQYAFEQEGFDLSLYTHFLVEGIEKGIADQDNDGWISVEELHDFVSYKVKETSPAMTPEFYPVKEGYKILLAKSPKDDPKLKYRKEVEKKAYQGKFTIPARRQLNALRPLLGLTAPDAEAIEAEVLQPYLEYKHKLQEYEQTLQESLQAENPLSQRALDDLKDYQLFLGLRDEDIEPIHKGNLLQDSIKSISQETAIPEKEQLYHQASQPEPDDLSSETGVDYTKLRNLLAAGKWKEADYETYLVMLQAVGHKEIGRIRDEELLNFPCTDLRTINRLWVKYSNGRFGFSVQKEIYLSVGGKLDGKYDEEAFYKFGDRVGWRVESNWISYSEVTFDTSAAVGHLPGFGWFSLRVGVLVEWWWSLFSRIETCKL